ncbi:hypothetical protein [Moorena sp. SIO3H5]|uniref:hypothetical protein n=1 Tax=Moorena sp. SIO3H5 TaxID=2607834 RepID=UPI0013BAF95F|nr:hypothetical protein [Moorena sp. SIO3H5]NEO71956.1 hypothetical protein [Moorena sp. SIO3H5]
MPIPRTDAHSTHQCQTAKAMQRGLGGFPHERLHQDNEMQPRSGKKYCVPKFNAVPKVPLS